MRAPTAPAAVLRSRYSVSDPQPCLVVPSTSREHRARHGDGGRRREHSRDVDDPAGLRAGAQVVLLDPRQLVPLPRDEALLGGELVALAALEEAQRVLLHGVEPLHRDPLARAAQDLPHPDGEDVAVVQELGDRLGLLRHPVGEPVQPDLGVGVHDRVPLRARAADRESNRGGVAGRPVGRDELALLFLEVREPRGELLIRLGTGRVPFRPLLLAPEMRPDEIGERGRPDELGRPRPPVLGYRCVHGRQASHVAGFGW